MLGIHPFMLDSLCRRRSTLLRWRHDYERSRCEGIEYIEGHAGFLVEVAYRPFSPNRRIAESILELFDLGPWIVSFFRPSFLADSIMPPFRTLLQEHVNVCLIRMEV